MKNCIILLILLFSNQSFSQSKNVNSKTNIIVDTFKWEKDFRYGHVVFENNDTLWFVNHEAWEKYYQNVVPEYIKKNRIKTAGQPRMYHKMGQ